MKIGSHKFVAEMPPLLANGLELPGELHEHEDGRFHIYFCAEDESESLSYDYTRVGYRDFDSYTILLGLRVASSLRGRGLGEEIVKYFMDHTAERGQEFGETGLIYKPVIGLTLARVGLRPLCDDVLVRILPRSTQDETREPKIQVVQNRHGVELNGDRPSGGKFYSVLSPEEVRVKYPLDLPDTLVALNTQYEPVR